MNAIRKATLHDLDPLAHLFDGYRVFYKKESDLMACKAFLKERMTNEESEIFIALNEEEIITGFVQLYPSFSSTRMKRLWILNDLFVNPVYRGQGISKKLIEQAKALSLQSGSCGLLLDTAKTNTIGNKLYPAVGFVLDEAYNHYFWESK